MSLTKMVNGCGQSTGATVATKTTTTTSTAMSNDDRHQHRIGYWWSDKKNLKINGDELESLLTDFNCKLVKLNLDVSFESQGPFDAIIHKLSDIMVKADAGEDKAKRIITQFQEYCDQNPRMIVFDRLENVRLLIDRYRQYKQIVESGLGGSVFTPTFVELTTKDKQLNIQKLKEGNVQYPFVCKPSVAHGSSSAHQMSLIFSEEGLNDITVPCVAQTFVNHNARLFKLFVIKDRYFTIERPSLKNFTSGNHPTVHFSSHDISKPHSSSTLTSLDKDDPFAKVILEPETEHLDRIVKALSGQLGLALYGIDVIIANETGHYAIIDMNAFPGYDGVDNILALVRDMLVDAIKAKSDDQSLKKEPRVFSRTKNTEIKSKGTTELNNKDSPVSKNSEERTTERKEIHVNGDIDSGIDTSDSCDEKKHIPPVVQSRSFRRQHAKNIGNSVIGSPNLN